MTKYLWKIDGGGITIYIISDSKNKAMREAVDMIWDVRPSHKDYHNYLESLLVARLTYTEID